MTMQGQEYAVFTEFSPDNKTMTPGFNARVFTDVTATGQQYPVRLQNRRDHARAGFVSHNGVLHVDVQFRR